jgi:hypothetical protein
MGSARKGDYRLAGSGLTSRSEAAISKEKEIKDILAKQEARLSENKEKRQTAKEELNVFKKEQIQPVQQELKALQQQVTPVFVRGSGLVKPKLEGEDLSAAKQKRDTLKKKQQELLTEAKQKRAEIKTGQKEDRFFQNRELSPLERDVNFAGSRTRNRSNLAVYDPLLERARKLGQV